MTAQSWTAALQANPLPWLLEPDNPPVRYWTLVDLLDRPANDAAVDSASRAIPEYPPLAELLVAQKSGGHWVKRDYYLPKNTGTFWVLSVLADLGLTAGDEHVRSGCEFIFSHQRDDGSFCRRRSLPGQGIVWEHQPDPCTHARIVRFLIQFGYGDDLRTRRAIQWLLARQRDDGMWLCDRAGRHGCLRATVDFLRAAALDPATADLSATRRAAGIIVDLLMKPHMGRYHVADTWTILEYPPFGYGVLSALEALGSLGHTVVHPNVAQAVDYVLSRQLPDGSWPLDRLARRPPLEFGPPEQPNKWVTLEALRALKSIK